MPDPITNQVWAVIGQWIVYGASITGAVMAIAQFVKWVRSKTTVAKLEQTVNTHSELLERDHKRISYLEEKATKTESDLDDIHKLMRLSIKASQALLKSNLDGNNRDAVQDVSNEIQNYLNDQI